MRLDRILHRTRITTTASVAVALVALGLGGCGGSMMVDPAQVNLVPSWRSIVPPRNDEFAKSQVNTRKPVTPADLVDPQGACSGGGEPAPAPEPSADGLMLTRGVGLDMTECQVVQILGPAGSTEIGRNPGGDRTVVMTYTNHEQAGIYRFTSGRLTSIERLPDAGTSDKPARRGSHRRS
ncbi:hypothetical protein A33M_2650 [Rhodovulum sp. PH10]|uniref:hypothetical protein n=1 Tax=Rhodovulum sp. PH10 TaxID=1187851 RepID=UPI00027C235E|nr:hypothetical protein [Rhodovulum sp. PH10]EJW11869.1 hypothetical protein A33M_2650 [Rhodovulum sp. PH10]